MKISDYPLIDKEGGHRHGGLDAFEKALSKGEVRLIQSMACFPGLPEVLVAQWEVVVVLPGKANVIFRVGNFGDKKKAQALHKDTLKAQGNILQEKKARVAAARARTMEHRKTAKAEIERICSMSPEEYAEYRKERDREFEALVRNESSSEQAL